jgi:hypothetical protein
MFAQVWERLDLDCRRVVLDEHVEVAILRAEQGRRPGWRAGESYFDRPASEGGEEVAGRISKR